MIRRIVVSTVAPIVLVGLLILTSGIPGHAVDNDLVCKDVSQRQRAGPPAGGPQGLCPDIVEQISHLQIQNEHQREKLRFSTTHINIGDGPLQIRGGGQIAPCNIDGIHYDQCTIATQELLDAAGNVVATHPAGVAFFHPEHNHWHQSAVAAFILKAGDPFTGVPVATGVKITFCFVDVKTYSSTGEEKKAYPRTYFECNGDFQGLAAHWADEYLEAGEAPRRHGPVAWRRAFWIPLH